MDAVRIQDIKKTLYAYRNGIIADRLRNAGDCHAVIFGLNIPQLMNIANELGKNLNIARELWNNSASRESRLLAPMLFPCDNMDFAEACKWIESVENVEITDNLCHKLLKKLPFAENLFLKYSSSGHDLLRYAAFRLAMNLLSINADCNRTLILNSAKQELEAKCQLTKRLCDEIIEEIELGQQG